MKTVFAEGYLHGKNPVEIICMKCKKPNFGEIEKLFKMSSAEISLQSTFNCQNKLIVV